MKISKPVFHFRLTIGMKYVKRKKRSEKYRPGEGWSEKTGTTETKTPQLTQLLFWRKYYLFIQRIIRNTSVHAVGTIRIPL